MSEPKLNLRRPTKLFCAQVFAWFVLTSFASASAQEARRDWPMFRGGPQSTGVASSSLPDNLELVWEVNIGKAVFSTAAIVETDDQQVVYIADADGVLVSLELESGKRRWTFETETGVGFSASPSVHGGYVFIGDIAGVFYCIDDEGNLVWKSEEPFAEIISSANFHDGSVVFGSKDATMYCLDAETGEPVWTFEADDQIRCTPTIVDGRAFVAGCDGLFRAIELENGTELGSVEIASQTGATPAAVGDTVYFGTHQAGLYAVQWRQPEIKWQFLPDDGIEILGNPSVSGTHVVFGASDGVVRSLDPETAQENWTVSLKAPVKSSPVIAGNRVLVGSSDGRFYVLGLEDGAIQLELEFEGGFTASPAVGFDRVVIATDRGTVYCLGQAN